MAASLMWIADNGTYKPVKAIWVADNGVFKLVKSAWQADNGIYKPIKGIGGASHLNTFSVVPDPSAASSGFRLSWTGSGNAEAVEIWANGSSVSRWTNTSSGTYTWRNFTTQQPRPGTPYTFTIGESIGGKMTMRNDLTKVNQVLPQPAPPTNLLATKSTALSMLVFWNNSEDWTTGYNIITDEPNVKVMGHKNNSVVLPATPKQTYRISVHSTVYDAISRPAVTDYTHSPSYTSGWKTITPAVSRTWASGINDYRPVDADRFHGNGGDFDSAKFATQSTSFFYWQSSTAANPFQVVIDALENGGTITSFQIQIHRLSGGYTRGIPLTVQTHVHKIKPVGDSEPKTENNRISVGSLSIGEVTWTTLPNSFASLLLANSGRGLTIGKISSPAKTHYMRLHNGVFNTGQLRFKID
jgi:hypothetical protein